MKSFTFSISKKVESQIEELFLADELFRFNDYKLSSDILVEFASYLPKFLDAKLTKLRYAENLSKNYRKNASKGKKIA